MNKIHFGLVIFLFLIISCSGNTSDSNDETTVDEDIENITSSLNKTTSLFSGLEDGEFSTFVKSFAGIQSGNVTSDDWIEDVFSGLEDFVDADATEDNRRFDFNAHAGTYTYNHNTGGWSQSSSANSIVLLFPSSESASDNDMALTLSGYQDGTANIDGDSYYLPTSFLIVAEKSGTEIFKFHLKEINYSNDPDFPLPTVVDLDVYTAPVSYTLTFNRSSSKDFSLGFSLTNEDELITAFELALKLAHDDYDNLMEEDLEKLTGNIQLTSDLTLEFEAELGTLFSLNDPSENQINTMITCNVLYNGTNIGELEYVEAEDDIFIVYKDGTSESASRYYEKFAEDIEAIFFPFAGDWVDF
ncbi:MAG: hypothetical protein WD059_12370 [Balneolaceae bacterium]